MKNIDKDIRDAKDRIAKSVGKAVEKEVKPNFFRDIDPYLDALRTYKKSKVFGNPDTNRQIRDLFQKYVDPKPISHTCGTCLKRMYNVLIGEYGRRPKRGRKKVL